jgi:hypothetical protein
MFLDLFLSEESLELRTTLALAFASLLSIPFRGLGGEEAKASAEVVLFSKGSSVMRPGCKPPR